ncbi:Aldehyde/histidinol dehydrogenase [Powellomyces hirtus]|nr:Aldehyde/histidinol dehydrogenase [Powellomyces hirtus]
MTVAESPELRPFLRELTNLIDGKKTVPTSVCEEAQLDVDGVTRDANTLEPLSAIVATSDEELARAISVADAFHKKGEWAKTTLQERQVVFDRIAEELEKRGHLASQAEAIDIGVVGFMREMAGKLGPKVFRRDLQALMGEFPAHKDIEVEGKKVAELTWHPRGPSVVICPTNAPIGSALVQIGLAVQSGCPVIVKPSTWSPHSYNVVVDALVAADIPPGLIQIVHGGTHVGKQLVESTLTASVCFTGSVAGGLAIAAACAVQCKPYVLELGGSNPFVVLADADLEVAATALVSSLTFVNGQYCCGAGRVLVHAAVRSEFLEIVRTKFAAVKVGSSMDEASEVGPLCVGLAKPLMQKIDEIMQSPGVTSLSSTPLPKDLSGHFMGPTLLLDAPVNKNELFGPVATLNSFNTMEEAITMAETAQSRLKGYIYGKDTTTVRQIMGSVSCNWWDWNVFEPATPGHSRTGFIGLCGYGLLTPEMFMYSKYVSIGSS